MAELIRIKNEKMGRLESVKNETGMYFTLVLILSLLGFLYATDFLLEKLWRLKRAIFFRN